MSDPFQRARDIRAGKLDNEMPDYEELTGWMQRCPKTWIGGLLAHVVHRAAIEPFFRDDTALLLFVTKVMKDAQNPLSVLREQEPTK